jgi:hypothetical protein
MIAVDTNLLVYARVPESPWHFKARAVLQPCLNASAQWAVPWPCVHEFYSVVTNPRIFNKPLSSAEAFAFLDVLNSGGNLRFIGEGPSHLERLRELAVPARLSGGAIHDARIAAICLEHGVHELWSADRDFVRWPQLKVVNPLAG